MNNPKNWPISAPPYFSSEGYQYEKKLAKEKILFQIKDKRAQTLLEHHEHMRNVADLMDNTEMYFRQHEEIMHLIKERLSLLEQYKEALLYGGFE